MATSRRISFGAGRKVSLKAGGFSIVSRRLPPAANTLFCRETVLLSWDSQDLAQKWGSCYNPLLLFWPSGRALSETAYRIFPCSFSHEILGLHCCLDAWVQWPVDCR